MKNISFKMLRGIIASVALLLFCAPGFPADTEENARPSIQLSFGVYQSDKATVMYRKFLPVLEYIQDQMEQSMGVPVDIELRIFKDYSSANSALVSGAVDFVRFGPASYIIAKNRNRDIQLLVMEAINGGKRFQGLIVARTDSPIKRLSDLHGKSFAFGDSKSTIGRYLSQAQLIEAGIHARNLSGYDYLDRHDKVFTAVEIGDYDAGALKEGTFNKLNKNGTLKIISAFDNATKPWIARAGLADDITSAIRASLLALTDQEILGIFKASGFLPTHDDEYDFVRRGMVQSEQFGH